MNISSHRNILDKLIDEKRLELDCNNYILRYTRINKLVQCSHY